MKVKTVLLILLLFLSYYTIETLGAEHGLSSQEAVNKQQEALDLEALEVFIHEVDQDVKGYLPEISLSNIIERFKNGELNIAPQELIKGLGSYFFMEVRANLGLLGKVLLIGILCSVLQTLRSAFENGTVARLAYYVCFLAVITLVMGSFHVAASAGLLAVQRMVAFIKLLLPIFLVLLTVMGGLTSAALLQPFMLAFFSILGALTEGVIFPLIYLTAVLAVANSLSESFKVSRLAGLLKQITKVGLGFVLTLFVGVITVEGVAGAVVDGVTLRTAKFMTGAFVPVAGSMFADALDAVIGGSLLLKNAIGLTGVLVLAVIVLFPVLKILAIAMVYRLAGALLQPLGDTLISEALEELSSSLFIIFAAVLTVAIMFFMSIVIFVATANFTVMLR